MSNYGVGSGLGLVKSFTIEANNALIENPSLISHNDRDYPLMDGVDSEVGKGRPQWAYR